MLFSDKLHFAFFILLFWHFTCLDVNKLLSCFFFMHWFYSWWLWDVLDKSNVGYHEIAMKLLHFFYMTVALWLSLIIPTQDATEHDTFLWESIYDSVNCSVLSTFTTSVDMKCSKRILQVCQENTTRMRCTFERFSIFYMWLVIVPRYRRIFNDLGRIPLFLACIFAFQSKFVLGSKKYLFFTGPCVIKLCLGRPGRGFGLSNCYLGYNRM